MTSYGYNIMIIVDSCMIWFHFDCNMQLKKSYYIATNVCNRKSATTFDDLPDCLVDMSTFVPTIAILDTGHPFIVKHQNLPTNLFLLVNIIL